MLVQTVILTALVAFGNANPVSPSYDTIIVGMGASGCAAAAELSRAGKRVLALEAMDRIGGRVHTVPFGDALVEVGAEWIHGSGKSPTYELAIQNNITILSQNLTMQVFRSDGSRTDEALINELLNYALEVQEERPEKPEPIGQFVTRKLTEYITSNHPNLLKDQGFMDQLFKIVALEVDTYESSSNWNELTTHGSSEALDGDQHLSWHRYGYKTLFEILLNTYNGGLGLQNLEIKTQKVVSKISYPQNPEEDVTVTCEDGSVYKAKNVIVTVSVGVLKERHATLFSPALPQSKITAIEKISLGVIGKIILLFPNQWWGEIKSDAFMFVWKPEDLKTVDQDWMTDVAGTSITMGNRNAMTVWTRGETAKLVETLPEDIVKTKAMQLIRTFMGKDKTIPEPINMVRSKWFANPYVRGTYTFDNVETPQHPTARADLAAPLVDSSGAPRVLFAGEASELKHFSTVHGAVETGRREAKRLLNKSN